MTDVGQGSTADSNLNPEEFKKAQPRLLEEKHSGAMANIKELQELEKYMFKNLQDVTKGSEGAEAQEQAIRTRILELKQMRMSLFDKLKHLYTDTQDRVNVNRRDLADQIAVGKTMQDELDNTEDTLRQLQAEKNSKMRLIKIGEWEYDRYYETKEIIKRLVYCSMACMVILFAMRTPWVPPWSGVLALGLVIGFTLISIAKRVSWNMRRDHHDYDKFIQSYDNSRFAEGKDTANVTKKKFNVNDLLGLASCKNAALVAAKAKGAAMQVASESAEMSPDEINNMNANVDKSISGSEGFNNIQPIEIGGVNQFSYLY